jgi:hypothetical protein
MGMVSAKLRAWYFSVSDTADTSVVVRVSDFRPHANLVSKHVTTVHMLMPTPAFLQALFPANKGGIN